MPRSPGPEGPSSAASLGEAAPDEVPVSVDLLRADLYRLLDQLVRARSDHRRHLILEFERAWEQLKDATAEG
jgi:hypothetical protein